MNPLEWLSNLYGINVSEWERVLTVTWVFLTPPMLTMTTLVLLVRLCAGGRWKRRMPRASLALVSSYMFIMWRFVYLRVTGEATLGQPWALLLLSYAFWATAYFSAALMLEQVIPFLFRVGFWVGVRICCFSWGKRVCESRICNWLYGYFTRTYAVSQGLNDE